MQDGLTLNGTLTLGALSGNLYGYLNFVGSQTLGGTGTVVFGQSIYNTLLASEAGTTLTIGPEITVRGQSGSVGYDTSLTSTSTDVAVVNQGTIQADVAGGTITIDGTAGENAGTLNALNGATVSLQASNFQDIGTNYADATSAFSLGGSFSSSGNTLALSGPGTFTLSGTIQGGTVSVAAGTNFDDSGTLDGVTLDGNAVVSGNTGATVLDGLTLNGTLAVGSPSTNLFGYVEFSGTQTLGGTGAVVFGESIDNALIVSEAATALTIGPGVTVRGQTGTVGYDENVSSTPTNIVVVNQGTIQADVAGGTLTIDGTGSENEAALNALNGATLYIEDTLANTGTVSVDSTSVLELGGTVVGGTITGQGSALLYGGTLDGVTIDGILTMSNNSSVVVQDGLTVNGTLVLGSASLSAVWAYLDFTGSQTLGGTGTVVFGQSIYNTLLVSEAATTLTIGPGITVRGQSGSVGYDNNLVTSPTNISVINEGTIQADVAAGVITVDGTGSENQGELKALDGGTLFVGDTLTNTGTVSLDGTSTLELGGTLAGGTIDTQTGAQIHGATLDGVTIDGNFTVAENNSLTVAGGLTLNGTMSVGAPSSNNAYGYVSFAGTQTLGGAGAVVFGEDQYNTLLVSEAGTTLTIGPEITVEGQNGTVGYNSNLVSTPTNVSVVNQGTIQADLAGTTITFTGTGNQNSGTLEAASGGILAIAGTWTNSGTVEAGASGLVSATTPTNLSAGTLSGGTWIAGSNGSLSLGASITTAAATIILSGTSATFSGLSGLSAIAPGGSIELLQGAAFTTTGDLDNAGTINLADPGILNVSGAYTQESTGVFDVGIGGTTAGSQYGQLNVTGQATLNGALNVSLLNGFTPAASNSFEIMTFGSFAGSFTTETGLNIGGGLVFTPTFSATSLALVAGGASSYTVTTTADSGPGSLRAAILAGDASSGGFTINFDIPTSDPGYASSFVPTYNFTIQYWTIAPTSPLPAITTSTTINGYSQLGFSTYVAGIVLSGANAGSGADGLDLTGNGVSVLALTINGFSGAGINIESSGNIIQDCYVGTDFSVLNSVGNGVGMQITGASNLIGTDGQGGSAQDGLEGDVVSGNVGSGIWIDGPGATGNVVGGDWIGINGTGAAALANGQDGVLLSNGASHNWIGVNPVNGPEDSDQKNFISGNTGDGVELSGAGTTGNVIAGNYIGTDFTGTLAVPNYAGVEIDSGATGNLIGSNGDGVSDALERNVLSGNLFAGVWMTGTGTDDNVVSGNYIGTTVTGDTALGNSSVVLYDSFGNELGAGVVLDSGASDNLIGTTGQSADDAGQRNIISGNLDDGIDIEYSGTVGNVVAGNFIGTNAAGTAAVANQGQAVEIAELTGVNWIGVNPVYGPENADDGNLISGNLYDATQYFYANGGVEAGNLMGTDVTGTVAIPNYDGVELYDSSNILLGSSGQDGSTDDALERNVISGNNRWGVRIVNIIFAGLPAPVTTGDVVAGNYIGTNAAGTAALANGTVDDGYGVWVAIGAQGNWIGVNPVYGAPSPDEGNVISGNLGGGVVMTNAGTSDNVIAGNLIGTNAAGTAAIGNGGADGVDIEGGATSNWVGVNPLGGAETSIERNVISGNADAGVVITGSGTTGNVIAGNLIGLNVNGSGGVIDGLGDGFAGVELTSGAAGNWIGVNAIDGSENTLERNVISGSYISVALYDTGTTGNVVAGDLLGTDPTGTAAVPNQTFDAPLSWGVVIAVGASSNLIGTSGQDGANDALERNVISGFHNAGVYIYEFQGSQGAPTTGNVVAGNDIGTTEAGTAALGNDDGVVISIGASNNWVGVNPIYGPQNADQSNVISGNSNAGVELNSTGTSNNTVAGNYIGTDYTGTHALPNYAGVEIDSGATSNLIGSNGDGVDDALERNVISGNSLVGVWITGAGTNNNVVAGDYIGTGVTGMIALPNGTTPVNTPKTDLTGCGVSIEAGASDNLIGTNGSSVDDAGERNVISGNDSDGVDITGSGTSGNTVAGNFIGLAANGTSAVANHLAGVLLNNGATSNTVGGLTAALRNNIAGNLNRGVYISTPAGSSVPTTQNVVEGNYIGTDVSGLLPITGNTNDAISIDLSPGNIIGGTVAALAM